MVRGCQKKIIYLKNTGSEVFKEAYFLVNDDIKSCDKNYEKEMIEEAKRILDEAISGEIKASLTFRIGNYFKTKIIPILIGIIIGIFITLLIK